MSRPKIIKSASKSSVRPSGSDGLTARVSELEELIERMQRDNEDLFSNIDSSNLSSEFLTRLKRIETNIKNIMDRLSALESQEVLKNDG